MQKLVLSCRGVWARMKKTVLSEKLVFWVLLAAFLAMLIPMLAIARYDVPSGDDFRFSQLTHDAWLQTGSVWQVLRAAARQAAVTYGDWQGTFAAVFLFALQPGIWGAGTYGLTTYIMMASLFTGLSVFCWYLLRRLLKASGHQAGIVILTALVACTQFLPSPEQGFYWYNGSVYYTFFFGLSLILYTLILRHVVPAGDDPFSRRRVLSLAGMCLLSVLIGGANYPTALITAIAYFLAVCALLLTKRYRKLDLLIPAAFFFGSFLTSALAPGNAVRQACSPDPFIPLAFVYAFQYAAICIRSWSTPPLICLLVFLIPILRPLALRTRFDFRFPLLPLGFSYCLLAATFFPPCYTMGNAGSPRLADIAYHTFVLLAIADLYYLLGWLDRASYRWARRVGVSPEAVSPAYPPAYQLAFTLCVAVLLAGSCLLTVDPTITSPRAAISLATGEASRYYDQYLQRLEALTDESQKEVVLPPFSSPPYVIFHDADVTDDPDDGSNAAVRAYFGKDSVLLG